MSHRHSRDWDLAEKKLQEARSREESPARYALGVADKHLNKSPSCMDKDYMRGYNSLAGEKS
jgi:hypothetical protein